MNLIVVVDNNWGIGKKNDLLYKLPKDMKFFREKTLNKIIIMGDNTILSLPNSKPLPNRTTIVLSKNEKLKIENAEVCNNLKELFVSLKKYNSKDVFVCGGATIYKLLLEYCDTAYITKVNATTADTEVFFENLDEKTNWEIVYKSEKQIDNGLEIQFLTYKNKDTKEYNNEI